LQLPFRLSSFTYSLRILPLHPFQGNLTTVVSSIYCILQKNYSTT
jgi:hypothetical protein